MKGNDELLNWEDYKKMDFTQQVRPILLSCIHTCSSL